PPVGDYDTKLIAIEEDLSNVGKPTQWGKLGEPRAKWVYEVESGEHRGEKIIKFTGQKLTQKSGCLELVTQMLGRVPGAGERVIMRDFIGRTFRIEVRPNVAKPGTTIIKGVYPLAGGPAPPTPAPTQPVGTPAQHTPSTN